MTNEKNILALMNLIFWVTLLTCLLLWEWYENRKEKVNKDEISFENSLQNLLKTTRRNQQKHDIELANDYFGKEALYQQKRSEIISRVSKITYISDQEKLEIKHRLETHRKEWKPDKYYPSSWWTYIENGWYNEPLKEYIKSLGYNTSHDGNIIDIVVTHPDEKTHYPL